MNQANLPLTEIFPYHANPRDFRETLPALKESITRFGYNSPIIVDKAHVIIAGHARYYALLELGFTSATVIVSDLPEDLAREWRIVDNKASEKASWDLDRLRAELRSVDESMVPFFDDSELKALLGGLEDIGQRTIKKEQVERAQKEVLGHFQKLHENMQDRTRFVKCQHCGKDFGFDADIVGMAGGLKA